jgi:hypothetical protein
MTIGLRPPMALMGTPAGNRMIFEVESAAISGERFTAKLKGQAAADWLTVGPDGTGTLDVRMLFETDDGALVFMQYRGRVDVSKTTGPVYTAPLFETGDERYAWMNRIQAVGRGSLEGDTLVYEICEVR